MRGWALAIAAMLAISPTAASATSYFGLAIDRKTLVVTDLRSPRLTSGTAQTFQVLIYREPTMAFHKMADYLVIETDIDCAKGKQQQLYSAAYSAAGVLVSSDIKKRPWAKITPDTKEDALKGVGCSAAIPHAGFAIGDKRVGEILAAYRAGRYDRYIH